RRFAFAICCQNKANHRVFGDGIQLVKIKLFKVSCHRLESVTSVCLFGQTSSIVLSGTRLRAVKEENVFVSLCHPLDNVARFGGLEAGIEMGIARLASKDFFAKEVYGA